MRKHNPKNERIKRRYLAYLEQARGRSASTADDVAAAIALFEASTGHKDFAKFHIEQAQRFKRLLDVKESAATGAKLAHSTVRHRLLALKAFFQWLAGQQGYRRITYSDAEYFNPSANDSRIATAVRERPAPSIEQIRHVVLGIEPRSDLDLRDRALIAFALLSGARDDAIASMSIKHVNLSARSVFQDARSVRTKNRKTFTSSFFPVGEDIEAIVLAWIDFLIRDRLFGPDDPLFPATARILDADGKFAAAGLDRRHWKSADAIRRIFRERFEAAGLPYFHPHSFRKTLAQLGEKICNREEWVAWSQNLGHERVATTYDSYGKVASHRQAEIFDKLRQADSAQLRGEPDDETVRRVIEYLKKKAA